MKYALPRSLRGSGCHMCDQLYHTMTSGHFQIFSQEHINRKSLAMTVNSTRLGKADNYINKHIEHYHHRPMIHCCVTVGMTVLPYQILPCESHSVAYLGQILL